MTDIEAGSRLCTVRICRRWTQKRLGAVVHGDQTKICCWEKGYHSMHATELGLMAHALNFSLDVFFRDGPFDITACLLPMPTDA